jgi:hypothetical protein
MASPMAKWAGRSVAARTASRMSCSLVEETKQVDATAVRAFNEAPHVKAVKGQGFVHCGSRAMAAPSPKKGCRRAIYGGETRFCGPK